MAVLRRRILPLILVASLAGCERGIVDLRADLHAVHALLVTGDDSVRVRVTRNDPRLATGEAPVANVVVRLASGGDTLMLDEVPPDAATAPEPAGPSGWYAAPVPGGIVPGQRYALLVDLPGAGRATGETVGLAMPDLLSPEPGTRLLLDPGSEVTLPIELEAPEGAAGAAVGFQLETLYTQGGAVVDAECRFPARDDPDPVPEPVDDLVEVVVPSPQCRLTGSFQPLAWDSLDVSLRTIVYDSAYVRYSEATFDASGVYLPHASAGMEGALGFLASAAVAEVVIRLVR